MTESENLKQKLNVCLSLEVYLFLLELAPSSKLEHRKAILNFLCLLFARDRQAPIEKDYDDYRYYLQILRKQDISRVERALSYAQRFFFLVSGKSQMHKP